MQRLCKYLIAAMAALAFAAAAFANPITGVIYQNVPDPGNAGDPANYANTLPYATFTVTALGIDFNSNVTSYTNPSAFLNGATLTPFNGYNLTPTNINNSEIVLSGQIYLTSGANNFTIDHDDGLVISVNGIGTVLNDPGATAPVNTPFTITAPSTGTYNFTLDYAECCGAPAVLEWAVPNGPPVGNVPEPNSGLLLGSGLMLGLLGFGASKLRS